MNTADLCPEGKKRHIEWFMWKECIPHSTRQWMKPKEIHAYRAYREHVDTCEQCNSYKDNTNK